MAATVARAFTKRMVSAQKIAHDVSETNCAIHESRL